MRKEKGLAIIYPKEGQLLNGGRREGSREGIRGGVGCRERETS